MLSTREILSKDDEASASSGPQLASDSPSKLPASPVTDAAHQLIGKRVRVRPNAVPPLPPPSLSTAGPSLLTGASDASAVGAQVRVRGGRQLSGDFHCFDKQGNIILSNAYEQRECRQARTSWTVPPMHVIRAQEHRAPHIWSGYAAFAACSRQQRALAAPRSHRPSSVNGRCLVGSTLYATRLAVDTRSGGRRQALRRDSNGLLLAVSWLW